MFLRDVGGLLLAYARRWRLGIFVVFVLATLQSLAVVFRPLPIRALIEPPTPGSFFATLEKLFAGIADRMWLYVGLVILIEVTILALRFTAEVRTAALTERVMRSIRGRIAENLLRGDYRAVAAAGPGAVIAAASSDVAAGRRRF